MILQQIKTIKHIIYEYKRLRLLSSVFRISSSWYWSNNYLRKKLLEEMRGIKYMNGCKGLDTYKDIHIQWS